MGELMSADVESDEFVICKTESATMPLKVNGKDIVLTKETVEEACELLKKNPAHLQNGSLQFQYRSTIGVVEAVMIGEMLAVNTTLSKLDLNCKEMK